MNEVKWVETFRSNYRESIAPSYRGITHMLSVLCVALLIISFSISNLVDVSLVELGVFIVTMIGVNFAEYAAHRWLGHKKRRFAGLFYQRHTGDHHHFFTNNTMAYNNSRDWRVVLFPFYLIFAFLLGIVLPFGYVLFTYATPNIAFTYAAAGICGYLFYEIMHFSYHIPYGAPAEQFFRVIPGWKQLRHLHTLHHSPKLMKKANFNITLPIFDVLLGTFCWKIR